MKNKGANRFHKCFIHTPIYSRCFYIIHTLLLNVYRRTNPYIYKKEFIVLYLLQCWHYLKYFLMFQNGLLDHLVLYLNNKILPNYFSRDYFTLAKKNVICTSVTKKYYLKSYCLDYWDFYSWDSSK